MEQVRTTDWMRYIPKIFSISIVLIFLGLILPAGFSDMVPLNDTYMWFFGFWFTTSEYATQSAGWPNDFYVDPFGNKLIIGGVGASVLLIIALILMSTASQNAKDERNNKVAAGTGLIGCIFAFIGPVFYYYFLDSEIVNMGVSVHWLAFDPSFGFYLPILGGVLGILGAIAAGYAFTLESKREPVEITPLKPAPDKLPIDKGPEVISHHESPTFCKNCGTKLVGEFCQECGAKAEL